MQDQNESSKLPFVVLRTTTGQSVLALVDTGASISVLAHGSAEKLGLKILASKLLTISGYNRTSTEISHIFQLSFETDGDPFSMIIAGAPRLPSTKFYSPLFTKRDAEFLKAESVNVESFDNDCVHNGRPIDMILGNDVLPHLLGSSKRLFLPSERYIEFTKFAPIVFPPPRISEFPYDPASVHLVDNFQSEAFINVLTTPCGSADPIERLIHEIAQLWNLENIGIEEPGPIESVKKDIRDLLDEFEKNLQKDANGDIMVSLPWNGKQSRLASNRGVAVKRLEQLIKSLTKGRDLLQEYHEIIRAQEESGIIEKVTSSMENDVDPLYYIPHRVVVKLASLTTKLRIVLDASSKKLGELSLNDCLEAGPSMLVDLYDILIRSRLTDFLVVADIEKAFHQVRLVPEDRNCTRFLWLRDSSKPPTRDNIIEYRFTRIPFGMTSSPFLLQATIHHFLKEIGKRICDRIRENIYVDNILITSNNQDEIQDIRISSRSAFKYMNMNLREFSTNCLEEMAKFPKDEVASDTTIKLLGYLWNTLNDTYTIKLAKLQESVPTKRQVASRMAETFDPLGLVAPLLVQFKLLIKDLWDEGIEWKTRIPKALVPRWDAIRAQFAEDSIMVPRLLRPRGPYKNFRILVFSDASKDTYACAIYLLYEYDDGSVETGLLTAKSKIKPSGCNTLTIPRLELLAIEVGAKVALTVVKAMTADRPSHIHFFSDSMVSLYWVLKGEQLKCWVSNRVKTIQNVVESQKSLEVSASFHHCPTDRNPADIATRGMASSELKDCSLWFKGPAFLKSPMTTWPCRLEGSISCPSEFRDLVSSELVQKKPKKSSEKSEIKDSAESTPNGTCMTVKCDEKYTSVVPFSRSNSLTKVVSYTHTILRFFFKLFKGRKWEGETMRSFAEAQDDPVKRREVARRLVFLEHYRESASNGWTFPSSLTPEKHQDGIWRVQRRVPSPVLENEQYKLILVHRNHLLARLLVVETHLKNVHLPPTYLVASLRTRYWITADRRLADSVVRACVNCQKVNNKPFDYPFSRRLPRFRTTPSTPFQHVGLDYAGPLWYRRDDGKSLDKAYVLVYTCLVTRATHIELLPDSSTVVYIQGLRNIFARRGVPTSIYSDNAATFSLGAKILTDDLSNYVPSTTLTSFLAQHEINFRTITPLAPWQGGIYERIVGIVKNQLRKEIGKTRLSFFELSHVLVRIESMLNSRPLTPNPRELDDLPALRPMDYILPTVMIDLPSESDGLQPGQSFDPSRNPSATERLALNHLSGIDEVLTRMWDIWIAGYLGFLRENVYKEKRSSLLIPRVGQVVLISTEKLARFLWPLGIIRELLPSEDGCVRSVAVYCKGKRFVRAVNLLIPLELEGYLSDDEEKHTQNKPPTQHVPPRIATFPIYSKTNGSFQNSQNRTETQNRDTSKTSNQIPCSSEQLVNASSSNQLTPNSRACRSGASAEKDNRDLAGQPVFPVPSSSLSRASRSGASAEKDNRDLAGQSVFPVPSSSSSRACRSGASAVKDNRDLTRHSVASVPTSSMSRASRSGASAENSVDSTSRRNSPPTDPSPNSRFTPRYSRLPTAASRSGAAERQDSSVLAQPGVSLPLNRVRAYLPRTAKTKQIQYAHVLDACVTSAPRSVDTPQAPVPAPVPLQQSHSTNSSN